MRRTRGGRAAALGQPGAGASSTGVPSQRWQVDRHRWPTVGAHSRPPAAICTAGCRPRPHTSSRTRCIGQISGAPVGSARRGPALTGRAAPLTLSGDVPTLVIVESPAKAKTVARHLGGGYDVRASVGHIADLPTKGLGVDVDNGFKPVGADAAREGRGQGAAVAPQNASELYLATDEDREGEIISWHLLQHLKPKVPVKRMVFHEITRSAITDAVANPRRRRRPGRRRRDPPHPRSPRGLGGLAGPLAQGQPRPGCRPGAEPGRASSWSASASGWPSSPRHWDIEALLATDPAFTAALVALGTKVASGKDFGDDGQPKGQVVVLTEEQAVALAEGLAGRDLEVRSVEEPLSSPKPPFMTSTLQQEADASCAVRPAGDACGPRSLRAASSPTCARTR